MTLILILLVILIVFGGGGGYYAHREYGYGGLGGVLVAVLFVVLVLYIVQGRL